MFRGKWRLLTYINHPRESDCRLCGFRSTIAPMSKVISLAQARETSGKHASTLHAVCEKTAASRALLNDLFRSLDLDVNRQRFRAFPEGYCREFGLSLEQIHAITDLDIQRLLKLGVAVVNLPRLTSIYGLDVKNLCEEQTGKSFQEVLENLTSK